MDKGDGARVANSGRAVVGLDEFAVSAVEQYLVLGELNATQNHAVVSEVGDQERGKRLGTSIKIEVEEREMGY